MSQSQRALLTCIEEGITSIRQAESQMDKGAALPNLGNDAVSQCSGVIDKLQLFKLWFLVHLKKDDLILCIAVVSIKNSY